MRGWIGGSWRLSPVQPRGVGGCSEKSEILVCTTVSIHPLRFIPSRVTRNAKRVVGSANVEIFVFGKKG